MVDICFFVAFSVFRFRIPRRAAIGDSVDKTAAVMAFSGLSRLEISHMIWALRVLFFEVFFSIESTL